MTVTLAEHDPGWFAEYEAERMRLLAQVPCLIALHHIGSTSVPGILAKPIIDMLGEVGGFTKLDAATDAFETLGYEVMGAFGIPGRRYFRKTTSAGRRSHHLHVFTTGSEHLERRLAFRDYLRAHPSVARAYSELKARLLEKSDDAEAYMDGKDPFIKDIEARALEWARGR
ncbi:MAG: GrpB family protein [Pseudomonadota bacterium]